MGRISGRIVDSSPIFRAFFACPERKAQDFLKFLVDTGTERTMLSQTTAERMGIDVSSLPRSPRRMLTVAGHSENKVLENVVFVLKSDDGKSEEIRLNDIRVHRIVTKSASDRKSLLAIPNLLGTDLLREGKFKFVLDYEKGETYLE